MRDVRGWKWEAAGVAVAVGVSVGAVRVGMLSDRKSENGHTTQRL